MPPPPPPPPPPAVAEALAFLDRLGPSTIALGLERMHAALARLGHPERTLRVLHVAGTNGKGSTCAFAARCFQEAGHRVGLYTSPHLVRVNERIRVDGEPIPDAALARRIGELRARLPELAAEPPGLTYFEFGTLLALWHFAQEGVDAVVLETGLGGRLDATSACSPAVTAVTPLSLEHTEYLGSTLSAIAGEKAGIFKPGVPAVVARQDAEAAAVLAARAHALGAPLLVEGRDFGLEAPGAGEGGGTFRGPGRVLGGLSLGLAGPHQWQNAAVAVAALGAFEAATGLAVPDAALRRGLAATRWPGRFEEVARGPSVVLDGAHNPGGVEVLVGALRAHYPGRPVHLVFGVLADKAHREMLARLLPACRSALLVAPDSPRALPPERYLAEARALLADTAPCPSLPEALALARSRAAPDGVVLVAGSLVLVGAARRTLVGE